MRGSSWHEFLADNCPADMIRKSQAHLMSRCLVYTELKRKKHNMVNNDDIKLYKISTV